MIFRWGAATIVLALLAVSTESGAAPPGARDPDWPCQQIKVPELSPAAIWSGPTIDPQKTDWKRDQQVANLVQRLALRRVPIETAQGLIQDYAKNANGQKQTGLLALMAGLFAVLNQERDSVMAGLDRFGARQRQLATAIRADNQKLRAAQADTPADANAVAQLTQQVTWESEVFQDRRQALSYACDVPTKIEQRLFALARTIQQQLN